jgi:hypothetical protein
MNSLQMTDGSIESNPCFRLALGDDGIRSSSREVEEPRATIDLASLAQINDPVSPLLQYLSNKDNVDNVHQSHAGSDYPPSGWWGRSFSNQSAASERFVGTLRARSGSDGESVAWSGRTLKYLRQRHDWRSAFKILLELTQLPVDWDRQGASPVDPTTAHFAENLLSLLSTGIPAPSFMPGPNGDVWAIWGDFGLNIEICFRSPGDIFSMVDDAWGEIQDFEEPDPGLALTTHVLSDLRRRASTGD